MDKSKSFFSSLYVSKFALLSYKRIYDYVDIRFSLNTFFDYNLGIQCQERNILDNHKKVSIYNRIFRIYFHIIQRFGSDRATEIGLKISKS